MEDHPARQSSHSCRAEFRAAAGGQASAETIQDSRSWGAQADRYSVERSPEQHDQTVVNQLGQDSPAASCRALALYLPANQVADQWALDRRLLLRIGKPDHPNLHAWAACPVEICRVNHAEHLAARAAIGRA